MLEIHNPDNSPVASDRSTKNETTKMKLVIRKKDEILFDPPSPVFSSKNAKRAEMDTNDFNEIEIENLEREAETCKNPIVYEAFSCEHATTGQANAELQCALGKKIKVEQTIQSYDATTVNFSNIEDKSEILTDWDSVSQSVISDGVLLIHDDGTYADGYSDFVVNKKTRQTKISWAEMRKKTFSRVSRSAKIDKNPTANQTVPRKHTSSLVLDLEDDLDNDFECLDLLRQCKK